MVQSRSANLSLALEQVLALARGEVPAHVVNPAAIVRWREKQLTAMGRQGPRNN
jgi:hypothetical protein